MYHETLSPLSDMLFLVSTKLLLLATRMYGVVSQYSQFLRHHIHISGLQIQRKEEGHLILAQAHLLFQGIPHLLEDMVRVSFDYSWEVLLRVPWLRCCVLVLTMDLRSIILAFSLSYLKGTVSMLLSH